MEPILSTNGAPSSMPKTRTISRRDGMKLLKRKLSGEDMHELFHLVEQAKNWMDRITTFMERIEK